MSIRLLSAAVLLCAASIAAADPTQEALHACAAQKDASERLACYDRVAAAVDALVAAPSAATRSAPTAAPPSPAPAMLAATTKTDASASGSAAPASVPSVAKTPQPPSLAVQKDPQSDPDFGLSVEDLRRKQQQGSGQPNAPRPAKPQPLVAHVAKVENPSGAQLTVKLDNGQIWRQTDGSGGVYISPNDTVTITPGALGGFLLTNADRRVVRVKRIL